LGAERLPLAVAHCGLDDRVLRREAVGLGPARRAGALLMHRPMGNAGALTAQGGVHGNPPSDIRRDLMGARPNGSTERQLVSRTQRARSA